MAMMAALRTDGYLHLPAIIAIAHIDVLGEKILRNPTLPHPHPP